MDYITKHSVIYICEMILFKHAHPFINFPNYVQIKNTIWRIFNNTHI